MKKAFLCVGLLLAGTAAFAQHHGAKTVSDSIKMVHLQEVQVVSTRVGEKTPMAFTDVSKGQIKKQNFGQDIPFLLSFTPSVVTASDAGTGVGYTYIHIRGTDPSRINITANGIPINDSESHQVYWTDLPDLASSLESIQIQRGAGTSTNGAGAFGASVNMQTNSLSSLPYAGLDGSYGSYNTHKETFRFGSGLINGHWAFDGRLSNIESDGYIDRASAKLNSYFLQGGYFNGNTEIKLITFNGLEKTYLAWDYASKEDMAKYGRTYNPCGQYTDDKGNIAYYKDQTDYYHQSHYQLLWNQILNAEWTFNMALHYTRGFGYYEQYKKKQDLSEYLLLSSVGDNVSDLIRRKQMENDFYGTIYSLSYKSNRMSASLGGGWNKYAGDHYGNVLWIHNYVGSVSPDYEYYRNHAKKTDANLYFKANYELIQGLNAYVDMQYRHINHKIDGPMDSFTDGTQDLLNIDKKYDFFNPKAGLYWTINPKNTFYASFSVAQKEPTRDDFENTPLSSLHSEKLYDWEVGYKYSSTRFSAGANVYYMDYKNQLVLTGEANSIGELISRNVDKSYRLGLELMASAQLCRGFRWDVNATFSKNRNKNLTLNVPVYDADWNKTGTQDVYLGNTHLSYSPDLIFNNILTYSHKGIQVALQSQYVSKQYMNNADFKDAMLDAYFVSNLNMAYTFKLPHVKSITAGVTVYNIFNEEYETNGYVDSLTYDGKGGVTTDWVGYSAQAPTNVLAHISFDF